MISINSLTVSFGGFTLLDNIDFHISDNDKIGLVGKNGAGKSTVMKLICGLQSPTSGSIDKPNDIRIGYLPQIMDHHKGRTVMEEALTAFDQVNAIQEELDEIGVTLASRTDYESESYMNLISRMNDLSDALAFFHSEPPEVLAEKTLLGLGFKDSDFGRKTETFSQGWNMRIELAKILLSDPDVLLLDEPTNHLDIPSREVLEAALADFEGTIIAVSHDRYFINKLSNKIFRITPEGFEKFDGDYDTYCDIVLNAPAVKNEAAAPKVNSYKLRKERESEINRLRGKIKRTEAEIDRLDGEITAANGILSSPEAAADYEKVIELTAKIEELTASQAVLLSEWEKMSARLAELTEE